MIRDREHLLIVAMIGKSFERVCEQRRESGCDGKDSGLGEQMSRVKRNDNAILHGCILLNDLGAILG